MTTGRPLYVLGLMIITCLHETNRIYKGNLYSESMMQIHVHVSSLVATGEFGSETYHKDSVIHYKFIVETDKMTGLHI